MAGGADAGADGGAGGGGGGDGRGPRGGSSGGRSLRGECPSVWLSPGAAAMPGAARGVPARKVPPRGGRGDGLGPGRRGRPRVPAGQAQSSVRGSGGGGLAGPSALPGAGWAVPFAAGPGAGALGAGRVSGGGRGRAGSGLQGAGPAAPRTPGNRFGEARACLPGVGAATAPGWARRQRAGIEEGVGLWTAAPRGRSEIVRVSYCFGNQTGIAF